MTLEAIYFIGQTIAAVALVISLIFVGIQLRQSIQQAKRVEAATRVAAMREAHGNLANWYMHTSQHQHLTSLIGKALNEFDSLSDDEVAQYITSGMALLSYAQNAFYEWRAGDLPDEQWKSWQAALQFLATPGGQKLWAMRRHGFADLFADYVEANVLNGVLPEGVFSWDRRNGGADKEDKEPNT
ncbi:hypothetical protein A8B75_19085 [Sphingomonadales bacterium EhC05]|nr:hypothetical protein A8B75_19085 [Sphingomonadales bacterium EhC05]